MIDVNIGEETLRIPQNQPELSYQLYKIDKPNLLVKDAILNPESDFDKAILRYCKENTTLKELNEVLYKLQNADLDIQEAMEPDILYDQYDSLQEILSHFEALKKDATKLISNFYCPLRIVFERGDKPDISDPGVSFEQEIRKGLEDYRKTDLNDMKHYFNRSKSAKEKIVSAVWDVEIHNGTLYGVVHTYLREKFTPKEELFWKQEIEAQAADGFGESFEQKQINTEEGTLYVSFWSPYVKNWGLTKTDFYY